MLRIPDDKLKFENLPRVVEIPRIVSEEAPKKEPVSLVKSILNSLQEKDGEIDRIAFEQDPLANKNQTGLYKVKARLLPDEILKKVAVQNDLIASIVQARSNHLASFGRRRPNRYSTGFRIESNPGVFDKLKPEDRDALQKKIDVAERLLSTCGSTTKINSTKHLTLSQWFSISVRNALTLGRIATEVVWVGEPGNRRPHHFRPIDVGTIHEIVPDQHQADSVRAEAKRKLEQVLGKKLIAEQQPPSEYEWVQVIDGIAQQVFTEKECLVHNFYPVADIEFGGYPLTPIDTCVTAVTTYINIGTHNKMYFQSGRGARGMLLIKSDDVKPEMIKMMRAQLNASNNGVQNAFRTPVIAVPSSGDISWASMDNGAGASQEFQYLCDQTARIILSAFQISPEELPGYSYLSRGANSQALSESNNEYKLEAARDVGIRPLLSQFEDFLNLRIMPLFFPELSEICQIKLLGLDAETADKEAQRLSEQSQLYGTYDDVLLQVEKEPLGLQYGGEIPLNPQVWNEIKAHLTMGELLERFFGKKDASKDPNLAFYQNPMWMQWQQLQMQKQQADQQAQMAQQQAQQAQAQPQQGQQDPNQGQQGAQPDPTADLSAGIDQALASMQKSEKQLPPHYRTLVSKQNKIIQATMDEWDKAGKETIKEIMGVASKFFPKD